MSLKKLTRSRSNLFERRYRRGESKTCPQKCRRRERKQSERQKQQNEHRRVPVIHHARIREIRGVKIGATSKKRASGGVVNRHVRIRKECGDVRRRGKDRNGG